LTFALQATKKETRMQSNSACMLLFENCTLIFQVSNAEAQLKILRLF